jgi:glyoxylase-like metal-dependent hydrolase (beta-lactamase superfamily II)
MNTYTTVGNARIFQIPLHEFPGLMGNVYLVITGNYKVEVGLEEIGLITREEFSLRNLTHILITHGHIDHFGGLPYIRERSTAQICIHELDRRIVSNHQERLSLAAHRLEEFLTEAGVKPEQRAKQIEMYKITKSLFQSVTVDQTYEAMGMKLGSFKFIHVPGHCAGHVMIRLDDVLFSGDHILEKTSPHQAPEQITLSTGLDTYLRSLEIARPFGKRVRLTLGGHENPIIDLDKRIDEIRGLHLERLNKILKLLGKPHTIAEVSRYLFGKVEGYTVLLALEEAGAHIEYLYQRGYLKIVNLSDIEESADLNPILYQCIECKINEI